MSSLKKAGRSAQWPSVTGRIRKSEAVRWKATSSHKSLFVNYEYAVGGTRYEGDRIALYTLGQEEVDALGQRYEADPAVSVYYDPANSAESVLVTGPRGDEKHGDVILATLGVVVGLAISVAGWLGRGSA